jgi:two-component system chemotaxis sensor kinase CheA
MPVSVEERSFIVDSIHRQPGISGSMILDGKTVMMIDIFEIIDKVYPEWKTEIKRDDKTDGTTVLLVEDSDFFREQVTKYLNDGGYKVIAASDGMEAWEKLQKHKDEVKLVVTDIEMPVMNGVNCAGKSEPISFFHHYRL